jgi:hypothetical protein
MRRLDAIRPRPTIGGTVTAGLVGLIATLLLIGFCSGAFRAKAVKRDPDPSEAPICLNLPVAARESTLRSFPDRMQIEVASVHQPHRDQYFLIDTQGVRYGCSRRVFDTAQEGEILTVRVKPIFGSDPHAMPFIQ